MSGVVESDSHSPVDLAPRKALPSWVIDLLNDGAGRHPNSRELFGALVKIAMSARRRGWTEIEYRDEVSTKGMRLRPDGEPSRV